jgi:hypothetical protein
VDGRSCPCFGLGSFGSHHSKAPSATPKVATVVAVHRVLVRGLTCGYGGQWRESGLLNYGCAPYLHVEHSTPAQVRATWRSVCRRDGPDSAPGRSLSTPESAQVNRLSDDFARALVEARSPGMAAVPREENPVLIYRRLGDQSLLTSG